MNARGRRDGCRIFTDGDCALMTRVTNVIALTPRRDDEDPVTIIFARDVLAGER